MAKDAADFERLDMKEEVWNADIFLKSATGAVLQLQCIF